MFWLGEEVLDRCVREAVTAVPRSGCRPITAMTVHLLWKAGLVRSCQYMPSEDDVYLSLLRLSGGGRVARYADRGTGGIRYVPR